MLRMRDVAQARSGHKQDKSQYLIRGEVRETKRMLTTYEGWERREKVVGETVELRIMIECFVWINVGIRTRLVALYAN